MSKNEDGSLAQIRRVRHEISEEFGHDPNRLVDYYIALQTSHAERLLETVAPKEESYEEMRGDVPTPRRPPTV